MDLFKFRTSMKLLYLTIVVLVKMIVMKKSHALTCPNVNVTAENVIICENRQLYMSCDHTPGTVLNIVHANYGRTSGDRCHHKYMSNKYCYAANSTTIVRNLCEGKVSCRVSAYNSVFGGDPCPGTYKYLEIRFQCKTSVNATLGSEPSFPTIDTYNYQIEIEANIIDKGKTVAAELYYSYYRNRAAVSVTEEGRKKKYFYNYDSDEIYQTDIFGCKVEQLTTSNDTFATWLLGYTYYGGRLHIATPKWQTDFEYDIEYGELYLGTATVRGIPVDHWQICGNWQPNSTMLIDYYFSRSWDTASSYRTVPVRTEVMIDKLLDNGTVYSLHHIYDYFNFNYYVDNDETVFETPIDIVCPGRKDTKPIPMLPETFYYRVEVVDSARELATYEDVWYDGHMRHYRRDYRPMYKHYPTFNTNPITEIHDYNIGVRYVIDSTLGNCTILPLTNTSGDAVMNFTSQNKVDSYILNLKNPLQLFDLDVNNFTYIGQYKERGLLCDVFVAVRPNLYINGFLDTTVNTTITFYFLAKYWTDYSNLRPYKIFNPPVKMEIHAREVGFAAVYNYMDFSADIPSLDVFDISPCFKDASKLKFQVKFPGTYKTTEGPMLKELAHREFAQHLNVTILRIQEVNLLYDDFYLYISATLLDRPPPPAQFEYIPGKVLEKIEDSDVYHVPFPMQCAALCVDNQAFICNSFDFCSNDQTCRLSRAHVGDGTVVLSSSKSCDHFSRSVQGTMPALNVKDAYNLLRQKVYDQSVTLSLSDTGTDYTAVDISVVFGWMTSNVEMPKLNDYFHYRIEIIIPFQKYTYEGEIWYDKTLELMREDVHFDTVIAPLDPMTIIDDYSTGLQYVVDRTSKNCTIRPIHADSFGAIHNYTLPYQENSTWSLRMKTPNELFFIDDTYDFVGQETVRGMLCNVFESLRLDFRVPSLQTDTNYQSVFRYFFLAGGWYEVSEERGGSIAQPVKLEITILEMDLFLVYNFYDFNNDRPYLSTYDVHQCFDTTEQNTFQIRFPGPYHPYLDTKTEMFQSEMVFAMSRLTLLPPLRFQRTTLYYDSNNVYVTSTMVGEARLLSYYTYVREGSVVKNPEGVYDSIQNLDSCVRLCYTNTDFVCNSFYYCPNEMQCLFSKQNVPNIPAPATPYACQAYSRTVTARDIAPPTDSEALRRLKNSIYRGQLQIVIPGPGILEPYGYTASEIRTDILNPTAQVDHNSALQRFTVFKNNSGSIDIDSQLDNLSVDDCAAACLDTKAFQCQGFYYCDTTFICGLMKTRPDKLPTITTDTSSFCYVYQRDYIDDYVQSPGYVYMTAADYSFYPVSTSSACAQSCSRDDELHCRSFQFCPKAKECFLFRGRTVGTPKLSGGTTCSYFTRNYLIDFQTVSNGTYMFSSVVEFSNVTPSQCAKVCVEQQGASCNGFYFCQQSSGCYLTSKGSGSEDGPGEPQVVIDTSSQASFCNYYKRLEPTQATTQTSTLSTTTKTTVATAAPIPVTCPTLPSSTSTQSTSTTTSTTTTTPTTTTTTTSTTTQPRTASPTCSCPQKTVLVEVPVTRTVARTTTITNGLPPTALQQTGETNKITPTSNTGTLVGVAVATFILGLAVGAAIVFLLQKRLPGNTKRGDEECEMNFTRLEENSVQDSTS